MNPVGVATILNGGEYEKSSINIITGSVDVWNIRDRADRDIDHNLRTDNDTRSLSSASSQLLEETSWQVNRCGQRARRRSYWRHCRRQERRGDRLARRCGWWRAVHL